MAMQILEQKIPISEVHELAKEWYEIMIKGTVDIERNRVALGSDYHMDTCELLVKDGSHQKDVWGFNIRFDDPSGKPTVEFDSLVNIKPAFGNLSRAIANQDIIKTATDIIYSWIIF